MDEVPEYDCDFDLPDESIELENKIFLLQLLDLEGGPQANNRKTRLLVKFTDEYPDRFGVPNSQRYKRTKWLLDRWKRDKHFAETKKALLSSALKPCTKPSCSFLLQEEKKSATAPATSNTSAPTTTSETKAAPTRKQTTAQDNNINSPPRVKKEASTKTTMKTFGSPLRMVNGSGTKKGKQTKAAVHCCSSFLSLY